MDIISDGKQRMNEKYDMYLLSSTMQIGRVTEFSKIKNAVIYGGVNYYLIIALKQYRLYHSNDTASLAWLQVSLFTWLAIPV